MKKLWEDYGRNQVKLAALEEDVREIKKICEAWRCKAMIAEQQRDEVRTFDEPLTDQFHYFLNNVFIGTHKVRRSAKRDASTS